MPELVSLVEKMGGRLTVKEDRKEGRRGFHKGGLINISPDLFKDSEQATKTLAHEIGHLNDYLPDMVSARGTLPNRVAGTRKMLVADFDGSLKDPKVRSKILAELKSASFYWRPLEKGSEANKKYMSYRNSGSELYADALSMLFVDPAKLQEMAPTFFSSFFEYLDSKPTFKREYFELQDLLFKGKASLLAERENAILNDFLKGEELERRKRMERDNWKSSVWHRVKRDLIDRNAKAYELEKTAKKAGVKIKPEDSPVYALNEYNYMGGQIKYYLETYVQPIMNVLEKHDLTWEDFGIYVAFKRITIGDRVDIANFRGHTPFTAQEQLGYMKERLGEEKYIALEMARKQFANGVQTVVEDAYERGGLYRDALYEKMKSNQAYASFRTLDHIMDSEVTSQVHEQIGTFSGIQNPADVTVRKLIETIRATERNYTRNKVLSFIKNNPQLFPDEVRNATVAWDKNREWFSPVNPTEPGWKIVKVLEKGELKGYYVHPEVAELFEMRDFGELNAVTSTLQWLNDHGPRALFITYNLGFQSYNLQRDFRRTWTNLYAKNPNKNLLALGVQVAVDYAKALPPAWRRSLGKPDMLIQEMEKNRLFSATFNQIIRGQDSEARQIEALLEQYNIDSGRESEQDTVWKKIRWPATKILEAIEIAGNTIESLPKIVGYRQLKASGMNMQELSDYVRTSIGSPDYYRRGNLHGWTNNMLLFSNAIKEGIRADINVATNPQTRFGFWYAKALIDFLPKIAMFGATMGVFGDDLEEMFKDVSDYDKTNFDIIPLGQNEEGKTMYLRIPHDETGRLLSSILWKGLTGADNDTVWTRDLADVFSFLGGQIPGVTPVISTPISMYQFTTGKNPYDSFRDRQVLTDDEQQAGGWYRTEPYLRWLWGENGGNTIFQLPVRVYQTDETIYNSIVKTPALGNVIGRTLKVSDYGVTESLNTAGEIVEKEDAKRRLDEKDLIREYSKQIRNSEGGDSTDIQKEFIQKVKEVRGVDELDKATGTRLLKRLRIASIESPEYDQYIDAIQYRVTNTAKLTVLEKVASDMEDEKYNELLRILYQNQIISEPVLIKARTY